MMLHFTLFVNIQFSYKFVFLTILFSVIKLTYAKQQAFLFTQEVLVETYHSAQVFQLAAGLDGIKRRRKDRRYAEGIEDAHRRNRKDRQINEVMHAKETTIF